MGGISKTFALFLTFIIAMSCLTMVLVRPANAQTMVKPSVPEFNVKYIDSSYYVPPVNGTDPYSGKTEKTSGGFWWYNKTVELTITPQPFNSYKDGQGHEIGLEYIVRYKGHFGQDWNYYPHNWEITNDYHTIFFGLGSENTDHSIPAPHADLGYLSSGDQVDFQVQTQIGYYNLTGDFMNPNSLVFYGEKSDWSNTQTLVIPDWHNTTSLTNPTPTSIPNYGPTSSPTPTPTVPEFSWLAILPFFASVLFIAIKLKHRSQKHL